MRRLYADEFHPHSELVTPQHPDTMPPFPVIDMHAHFGPLLLGDSYEERYDTRRSCEMLREAGIERIFCLELVWGEGYDRLCRKLEASDGMIVPIGSVDVFEALEPDFETRVAILTQKADEENIDVPYEVLEYIARNISSNIRELEGSLTSLDAHSKLMGTPITLELARSALNHLVKTQESRSITAELIIGIVADKYGVTAEDITGKRRSREIAVPRQVAMYLCREMTDLSTTSIGRAFGNRDHTTVMHGCDRITESIAADFAFKRRVEELMKLVECS